MVVRIPRAVCRRGGSARGERGMSLMEVTMAVAIFAAVIAVTAQSLVSFYVSIDMQKQRIEAANSCKAVMALLREKRDETSADFPDTFLGWVSAQQNEGWTDFLKTEDAGIRLREHTITVQCLSLAGDVAAAGDNPIRVHVTSRWLDRRGRPMRAELVTALTDE